MDEDIIYAETPAIDSQPYFNSAQLTTVRLASRLRRDFDASHASDWLDTIAAWQS